jgi:hypothetical protein
MAIQQVGGQTVYVITGSGRDPRLQSSGQSWANAVSQQKYRIYEQAVKDSMLKMQQEGASYEAQMKAMTQYRKDLVDARTKLLELKEKTASELVKEQARANKAAQVRVSTTTRATSQDTREPQILAQERFAQGLEKERNTAAEEAQNYAGAASRFRSRRELQKYQTELDQYENDVIAAIDRGEDPKTVTLNITDPKAKAIADSYASQVILSAQQNKIAKDKDAQLQSKMTEIEALRSPQPNVPPLLTAGEQPQGDFVPTTTTSRQVGYRPAVTAKDVATRQQSIDEQIAKIEKELQSLQTPTRDTRSLLERSGETAREILGQPNRTDRALEAQALGLSTLQGARLMAEESMPQGATPEQQMQHRRDTLAKALGRQVTPETQVTPPVTQAVTQPSAEPVGTVQQPTIPSNTVTPKQENIVEEIRQPTLQNQQEVLTADKKAILQPQVEGGVVIGYKYLDPTTRRQLYSLRFDEAMNQKRSDPNSEYYNAYKAANNEYLQLTGQLDLPKPSEMQKTIQQGSQSVRTAPYQTGYNLYGDNPLALSAYIYNTTPQALNKFQKMSYYMQVKQGLRQLGMDEKLLDQYSKHLGSKIVQDSSIEIIQTSPDSVKKSQALAKQQEAIVGERTQEDRNQVRGDTNKQSRKVVDTLYNPNRNATDEQKDKLYQSAIKQISMYPNLTQEQKTQAINYLVQKRFIDAPFIEPQVETETVQETVQETTPTETPSQTPLQSTTIEQVISQ